GPLVAPDISVVDGVNLNMDIEPIGPGFPSASPQGQSGSTWLGTNSQTGQFRSRIADRTSALGVVVRLGSSMSSVTTWECSFKTTRMTRTRMGTGLSPVSPTADFTSSWAEPSQERTHLAQASDAPEHQR